MYVRVSRFVVKPHRWEEAMEAIHKHSLPLLEQQPGFMRLVVCGDPDTGQGMLVATWQTKEQAERYLRSPRVLELVQPFLDIAKQAPEIFGFPVVIDHRKGDGNPD